MKYKGKTEKELAELFLLASVWGFEPTANPQIFQKDGVEVDLSATGLTEWCVGQTIINQLIDRGFKNG